MMQTIEPQRLKQVREIRGYTRDELGKKARLNKQTIFRLEKGEAPKPIRKKNLDRLAMVLDVGVDVLTGKKPLPVLTAKPQGPMDESSYQLNVRVSPAVRNAYELAARQYGVTRRLVGRRLVQKDGVVVTAYHATVGKERRLLRGGRNAR
jgi:DNA-binding XRE family transcriptional regulator